MIEITKAGTVALMKARIPWLLLFDIERGEKEDGENVFFKAFANRFLLTSQNCLWINK